MLTGRLLETISTLQTCGILGWLGMFGERVSDEDNLCVSPMASVGRPEHKLLA